MRERLTNERWGFETNCFVCEPRNSLGLRVPFFHDTDRGLVIAEPEFGPQHSGAPTLVHGGVQLALLDEAIAWAAIALASRFAVTAALAATFDRPVHLDRSYRIEASITDVTDTSLAAEGRIVDATDRVCTSSTATLVVLSEAQAVAAGAVIDDDTQRFLRDP